MDNTKVKLSVSIPFDKPNKNGSIFSIEAVEKAIGDFKEHMPILDYRDKWEDTKVIGYVNSAPHIISWDFENQVCTAEVYGTIFSCGAELKINEIEDNKITDFEITSIGLT